MIPHVASLEKLTHELARLPGVGPKTAARLAYFVLKSPVEYAEKLRQAVKDVKELVRECPTCFSYTEDHEACHFCTDVHRDNNILCVVEDPADIARLDSSGAFHGRYHVLQGTISPLDGIGPDDIKINELLDRIDNSQGKIEEVILALDADLEGDTTALYLAKLLKGREIRLTRIAHGVPIGGDIDYIDHRTLGRALENRIQL